MRLLAFCLFLLSFSVKTAEAEEHDHFGPESTSPRGAARAPAQTWEQLQTRLEQLAKTDSVAANELREYLAELDPDQRPRALAIGLDLTDSMQRLIALEARRPELSPQQYASQKRVLFSRFEAEMLRQMPRGMHDSFMRHMAPMFKRLDSELVTEHAAHWKESEPGAPSSQFSAQQNMSLNNLQAAVADASLAVQYDASNAAAWGVLTEANYRLGNYSAAAAAAARLQQLDPGNPVATAYLKLPGRDIGQGAPPGPKLLDAATALNPTESPAPAPPRGASGSQVPMTDPSVLRSNALAKQARESLKRRDLTRAIEQAEEAISINPKNVNAMYYKALAYARSDQFREALRETERGLALAPANAELLTGRAMVFNLMMLYKEALEESDKALRADPNAYHAFFMKAWALAGLGRRQDALAALKRATRLPEYAALYERALQLPGDADLLSLFRGEVSPRMRAEPTSDGESKRLLRYGLLVLTFVVSLGILSAVFGGKSRRQETTAPAAGRRAHGRPPDEAKAGPALGSYRILRKLGVGGMGVVYEAVDQTLERKVAIKKMRDEISSDPREKERFLREARTVAKLRHPNIVEIYSIEAEEGGDDAYLVFEYVDGRTLYDAIQASGKLGFDKALALIRPVASALDYAHGNGVIHRDLKPSNIMIDSSGAVKVMDFGVARLTMDSLSRLAMTNTIVGTPPYMAPEQEQGVVRKESDIYALAVCLYEMLTGTLPFAGIGAGMLMSKINKSYTPASRAAPGLPPGFDQALDKALSPDPDLRYRSAGEFLAALERLRAPR